MDFNLNINKNNLKFNKPDSNTIYDVLILGAGPAGLNSALYAKRKGLNVAILTNTIGGQVFDTSSVENYLGFKHMNGKDLVSEFVDHINSLSIPILKEVFIEKLNLEKDSNIKFVHLTNKQIFKAKSIIIALGSKTRKLGIQGEDEFLGKGVAYCAICDGPLFEDSDVVVAGGGNSAIEAAIDLAKIANKVTIIHRSQLRADQILINQIKNLSNVDIKLQTEIKEVIGDMLVNKLLLLDKNTNDEYMFSTEGLFVEIGYTPNSEIFKDFLALNSKGEIKIDNHCKTNIPGIFAAGDITTVPYKQIIISVGEGAKAALSANEYLNSLD